MRRYFLFVLAAFEGGIAAALVVIGLQLPTREDVSANFGRVERVTGGAESQVRLMREQVIDLRKQDLAGKADDLRRHTRTAADTAGRQSRVLHHGSRRRQLRDHPGSKPSAPRRTLPPRGSHCRARGRYSTPRSMRQGARKPV